MRNARPGPVAIQFATSRAGRPAPATLRRWALAVLAMTGTPGAVTLRVVDADEGAALNRAWRGKRKPTNVLSFPLATPPGVPEPQLGDIVVCAPVVKREAKAQRKRLEHHWAHLLVHGTLHLLGYTHEEQAEAVLMESAERCVLARHAIPDPYLLQDPEPDGAV